MIQKAPETNILKAVAKAVLTEQRENHNEVLALKGERGGVDLYVPNYMDFLLEEEIITKSQMQWGRAYWNLQEAGMAFMATSKNKLYEDYAGEDGCEDFSTINELERDATAVYFILTRKMAAHHRQALDAACKSITGQSVNQRYEYIRAFGENTIVAAFEYLRKAIPEANEEYAIRIKEINNA